MDLDKAIEIAESAAREAGQLLLSGMNGHKVIARKSSAVDLVTEYDRAAERLIMERILAAFPEHLLVAEEGSQNHRKPEAGTYTWYVDPLDGTNNFSHGYPVFAVSIALYEREKPLAGVIYDPTRDECFSATAGGGAEMTTPQGKTKMRVSTVETLLDSLLATGFPYDRHTTADNNVAQLTAFLKRARGIRRAGAAALDMAYVACGRLDGFWELRLNSWDVAAGALLVQEAGGTVTTIGGEPLRMEGAVSIAASNGGIQHFILEVLREVARERPVSPVF